MANVQDAYVGVADEAVYGTPVVTTRFFEFLSEDVVGKYERIEAETVRAGTKVLRSDRFQPNPKGAGGSLKIEVLDSQFGFWLKHMMGAVATTGTAPKTHTGTVGDLTGKSFTLQSGRVTNAGVLVPFTYEGGKVKSWELSNKVDGVVQASFDLDFEAETIGAGAGAYAAATPSYTATGAAKLLTFQGGSCTIGGAAFAVSDASVKGDNGLKTDRWFLGGAKKEPLEEGMREYTFDLKGEFGAAADLDRIKSLTAAGALGKVVLTWASPTAGNSLVLTIETARFDEGIPKSDGAKIPEVSLAGKAVFDGTNSAVKLDYNTADATP